MLAIQSRTYHMIACDLVNSPAFVANFYRETTVYTPFAATGLGLFAIAMITALDCWERRKAKRIPAVTDEIPHLGAETIQEGITIMTLYLCWYTIRMLI